MNPKIKLNNAAEAANHKRSYVIGSIHKTTNEVSMAYTPSVHSAYPEALVESKRLAVLFPEKKFIIFQMLAFVSVADVVVE